eukprot:3434649-Rhodomonas_salina.2
MDWGLPRCREWERGDGVKEGVRAAGRAAGKTSAQWEQQDLQGHGASIAVRTRKHKWCNARIVVMEESGWTAHICVPSLPAPHQKERVSRSNGL